MEYIPNIKVNKAMTFMELLDYIEKPVWVDDGSNARWEIVGKLYRSKHGDYIAFRGSSTEYRLSSMNIFREEASERHHANA